MNLRNTQTAKDRREALEKKLGVNLQHIGSFTLDESIASSRNCENMIGVAQIPIGIAGPVNGKYIPLATTEGALVASVNRGCKAITQSGAASVDSYRVGATRGPVFRVNSLAESHLLATFLEKNFATLKKIAGQTSRHITLKSIKTRGVGKYRYVRFVFDTQDAMGMNMATIATEAMVAAIEEKTGVRCIALAGNYDVDKKPSWLNIIDGRGTKVWAEVTLRASVLSTVLKTTAKAMYETWLAKCMIGSAMAGSMGYNAHYANIVAALFLATGQDIAHVSEASVGITTAEILGKDLYVSVYLPDLMVGTVGGGTGLATQKEALALLGVSNSKEFAEVVGASVLAGEISLLASLSEGTLARAHKQLARGGK